MKKLFTICLSAFWLLGCAATAVTTEDVTARAESLDYGDHTSVTLTTRAWEALADKDYPAVFAYTGKVVELYGEEGKKMNAALTDFEPSSTAAKQWALNDVGTSLYIRATAYEKLKMYPQATEAYRTLADNYNFAQCWDPKGWFWRPADSARNKVKELQYLD